MKVWIVEEMNNYDQPYDLVGVVDSFDKAEPLYRAYVSKQYNYIARLEGEAALQKSIDQSVTRDMLITEVEVQ